MKQLHSVVAGSVVAGLLLLSLVACGGGGGGSSSGGGGVPQVTIANTSLSYYLPLHVGNKWTFTPGSYLTDVGAVTITCACLINGSAVERIDEYAATGAYAGTWFYDKTSASGLATTTLIGLSTNYGALVSLIINPTTLVVGIGTIDDTPSVGDNGSSGTWRSVITAVGGTYNLPDGRLIQSVASDNLTESTSGLNQVWQYARGVGYVSLSQGGQSAYLASFSIDAVNSYSVARGTESIGQPPAVTYITPQQAAPLIGAFTKAMF